MRKSMMMVLGLLLAFTGTVGVVLAQTAMVDLADDQSVGYGDTDDFHSGFDSVSGKLEWTDGTNTLMDLSDDGTTGTLTVNTISTTSISGFDVESLSTSGAAGTAPVSDGASGLTMTDIITETELDTESELETQLTDASNLIVSTEIDTEAELEALLGDTSNVFTNNDSDITINGFTVPDDTAANLGTDDDFVLTYDETTDDRLEITGAGYGSPYALWTPPNGQTYPSLQVEGQFIVGLDDMTGVASFFERSVDGVIAAVGANTGSLFLSHDGAATNLGTYGMGSTSGVLTLSKYYDSGLTSYSAIEVTDTLEGGTEYIDQIKLGGDSGSNEGHASTGGGVTLNFKGSDFDFTGDDADTTLLVNVGRDDNQAATVVFEGAATSAGASLSLKNAGDEDTNVEYWQFFANQDLQIKSDATVMLVLDDGESEVQIPVDLVVEGGVITGGVLDTTAGDVTLYPDSTTGNPTITLETPPDEDTNVYRYVMQPEYVSSASHFRIRAEGVSANYNQTALELEPGHGDGVSMRIGEDDVNNASNVKMFGSSGTEGAEWDLYNGATSDTEVNKWTFYASDSVATTAGNFGLWAKGGSVGGAPAGTEIWSVDDADLDLSFNQITNYKATMGTGTDDPAVDAPADWIEIQISGSTYYIPVYN